MIKKTVLILFPIVAILGVFFILKTQNSLDIVNTKQEPLEFKDNQEQCPECNMFLVGKKHTAQTVTSDGKTYFFDDIGCLILWIEENKKDSKSLVSWVYALDSNRWIKADKAFYSISDKTPMHYGFGAYEKNFDKSIEYNDMKLKMLRGENMTNTKIRKKIMDSIK
ncbi:MAG: hypothetical protein JJV95_01140 [Sulfurospirillum sp.]|nr:hypothetical protein [Sulfurospirillum sp.]MBL0702574.1 hypothetical protein [Sulfurospirillum sp.]